MSQGGGEVKREDCVAALGGAILHNVFPLFLVVVLLRLRPGMARGEVDSLRICRPGEGVDVFFSLRHGESFAAVGRDKIQLAWGFVFRIRVGIGVSGLVRCGLALGEEGDPTTIGRPFGIGVVSRLRQLDQRAALAVVVIEPEVAAEDLLVPVGALGVDDNEVSVGRNFYLRKVDNVEELVECKLGFVLRPEREGTSQDDHNSDGSFLDSHWVPGGKKGYTTPESSKASMRVADLELQVRRAVMLNSDPVLPGAKLEI